MLQVALAFLLFLAAAAIIERRAQPDPPRWRRPGIAWAAFLLLALACYGFLIGLTGRAFLSLALALTAAIALTWVSNSKYRLLREPLVFSDFALLPKVIRYPRLYYVELIQQLRTWCVAALIIVLLAFWFWIEPSRLEPAQRLALLLGAPLLLIALPALPWLGTAIRRAAATELPVPDPSGAIERLGLAASLSLSFLRWLSTRPHPAGTLLPAPRFCPRQTEKAPLVVAVQSESFMNLRRLRNDVPDLPNVTSAQASAALWGPLRVPSVGAYTMRTEYAFLTATPGCMLGFDAMDPYLRADRHPLPALPGLLSDAGWETVFIHPHVRDFFRRDKVMPALGFRRMITEEAFKGAERLGPYVSDAALTDEILRQLEQVEEPCFLFAVTMENHGPWRPGRLPGLAQEAQIYCQHLLHADAMLGRLLAFLKDSGRPWALCFFGDHPPILPSIGNPAPDHRSDYLILTSFDPPAGAPEEIDAAELGQRFREHVAALC